MCRNTDLEERRPPSVAAAQAAAEIPPSPASVAVRLRPSRIHADADGPLEGLPVVSSEAGKDKQSDEIEVGWIFGGKALGMLVGLFFSALRSPIFISSMRRTPSQRSPACRSSKVGRRLSLLLATVLGGAMHMSRIINVTVSSHEAAPSPSLLHAAIGACKSAKRKFGEYPYAYESLVRTRASRWKQEKKSVVPFLRAIDAKLGGHLYAQSKRIRFLQMLNDKLGGYLYATKLGVRTPEILFCGVAKDLPRNMTSLGRNYVVKPLQGHSARGVQVVREGVDILSNEPVSYRATLKKYGPEEPTIVEDLVESAHPAFKGRVPPDYKFQVFEGRPELMWLVDRNEGTKCKDYFDVSSDARWPYLKGFQFSRKMPNCRPTRQGDRIGHRHYLGPRRAAMDEAVQTLIRDIGPDWMRVDMYDGKRGPTLGEFTPFSSSGKALPLDSCVMPYLFIAHAERGEATDDAKTMREAEGIGEAKAWLGLQGAGSWWNRWRGRSNVGFSPKEVNRWNGYDELQKCKAVMEAQSELERKEKRTAEQQMTSSKE
ncbi:hypothetical protein ACHAXT_000664 [Thalassiosira profunda]